MKELGYEYGEALFALALENDSLESYHTALSLVADTFDGEKVYYEFLQNPTVAAKERVGCIKEAFGREIPTEVLSFLCLLCEKGRMGCFFEAFKTYTALYDAARRVTNVTVTSAVALTEDEKEKLMTKLCAAKGQTVNASYTVDPTILGGIIIETDGKIIDASLRRRLFEIKGVMNT